MKEINELHKKAMDLAEIAFIEKMKGNQDKANLLFNDAYNFEKKAALLLVDNYTAEPTRSVLFRSAASLAINCENYREAERMVCYGLSGSPTDTIAEELRDLQEQATLDHKSSVHDY